MLNSGHNRRSAWVIRTVGDEHEPTPFSTWAPKAIAKIRELPDTLRDRAVVLRLRRKLDGETITPLRMDRTEALGEIQCMAWRWAQDNLDKLRQCDPVMPAGLNDRARDNWRALLAIAEVIGGGWTDVAEATALALSGVSTSDDAEATPGVALLGDILSIFKEKKVEQITPQDLQEALVSMEESPWSDYRMGRCITTKGVARLLKPYNLRSHRTMDRRYYAKADFAEAWQCYLPPP